MSESKQLAGLLAPVCERLSAGAFEEAVDQANRLLAFIPSAGFSADSEAAVMFAAASLVGLTEGIDPDAVLAHHDHHLTPEQRYSLDCAAELVNVAEAASAVSVRGRVIPSLGAEALAILEAIGPIVYERAGNYPRTGIMADVWHNGARIAALGARLGPLFRCVGDLMSEWRACFMRGKFTTRLMGHYPHMVIPAMNDRADLLRRLGRRAEATHCYECVLKDCLWLLEQYANGEESPIEEDRAALGFLEKTYRGYLQSLEGEDTFDCEGQLRKIRSILERTSQNDSPKRGDPA